MPFERAAEADIDGREVLRRSGVAGALHELFQLVHGRFGFFELLRMNRDVRPQRQLIRLDGEGVAGSDRMGGTDQRERAEFLVLEPLDRIARLARVDVDLGHGEHGGGQRGIDGSRFLHPRDTRFEHFLGLLLERVQLGLRRALVLRKLRTAQIGTPQRLSGPQLRLAAARRVDAHFFEIRTRLVPLAPAGREAQQLQRCFVGILAAGPAVEDLLAQPLDLGCFELFVGFFRIGVQLDVRGQRDPRALTAGQALGIGPREKLAQHGRLVQVARVPFQETQIVTGRIEVLLAHRFVAEAQRRTQRLAGHRSDRFFLARQRLNLVAVVLAGQGPQLAGGRLHALKRTLGPPEGFGKRRRGIVVLGVLGARKRHQQHLGRPLVPAWMLGDRLDVLPGKAGQLPAVRVLGRQCGSLGLIGHGGQVANRQCVRIERIPAGFLLPALAALDRFGVSLFALGRETLQRVPRALGTQPAGLFGVGQLDQLAEAPQRLGRLAHLLIAASLAQAGQQSVGSRAVCFVVRAIALGRGGQVLLGRRAAGLVTGGQFEIDGRLQHPHSGQIPGQLLLALPRCLVGWIDELG